MEISGLRVVEDHDGAVWIMLRDRVLIYIKPDGTICAEGDVAAFEDIPKPP